MIRKKFSYPWGNRYVKYDSWVYKIGIVDKKNVTSTKEINTLTATNQEDYRKLLALYHKQKSETPNVEECNSHYFEYVDVFGNRIFEYLCGFVSAEQ